MPDVPKMQANRDKWYHTDEPVKQSNRWATLIAYTIVTLMVTALLMFVLTGCLYIQTVQQGVC